jgi:hypothetical protein
MAHSSRNKKFAVSRARPSARKAVYGHLRKRRRCVTTTARKFIHIVGDVVHPVTGVPLWRGLVKEKGDDREYVTLTPTEISYNLNKYEPTRDTTQSAENFEQRKDDKGKKLDCNAVLVSAWQRVVGPSPDMSQHYALYLDGADGKTTRALRGVDFRRSHLCVPNPFVQLDADVFDECRQRFMTVGHRIDRDELYRDPQPPCSYVWLDYCGTFRGNKHGRPRRDIERLFEAKLLAPRCMLAVTVCRRLDETGPDDCRQHVEALTAAARTEIKFHETDLYGSSMALLYWILHRYD